MIKKFTNNFSIWYIFIIITLSLVGLFFYLDMQHKSNISIAVGRKNGAYMQYAKEYQKILKEQYDIELTIKETNGSTQAQEYLLQEKVDFALAQSSTEKRGLLALANIAYEPIWIFYKDEKIQTFKDLQFRRNNIERQESGTHPVAKALLETINAPIHKQKKRGTKEALEELKAGTIDSLFVSIGIRSPIVNTIINTEGVKILNFQEAASYKNFFLKKSEKMNHEFNQTDYFNVIQLKKWSLNIEKELPPQETTLLATQTFLATKHSPDTMVRLMLKVAQEVHTKASFLNKENHFPNISSLKLKQHPASKAYFTERVHFYEELNLFHNFWLAQSLKKAETIIMKGFLPIILILGFGIEVIYPGLKMLSRRKINKWYRRVNLSDTNIDLLSLNELREHKNELELILLEIQNQDDIDPVHLEAYYSLQNQITNTVENFERRIKEKEAQQIYTENLI